MRKEAKKKAKKEHCKKKHWETEKNTKRQAAYMAKKQLMGVVVPNINKMYKKKQRAKVKVEEMPKWQRSYNQYMKKNLQCIFYEG